ncbi:MAG TPA: YigZ family protein [Niabella sp.]|nr:YigZ family protein [Niabella sp.]HQW15122.1 YigZ family protein [Niabella sp.]HQX20263.1 YigZ family protein [Niabella sp.]HQX41586.1 YigZ family protein [Niabella sp.]HRB07384.1 YigZ family protein [Niabella sp.]
MPLPDYFNTIETPGTAEFKDRGSRFIAMAIPIKSIAEFKTKLAEIKKEYPKATHYCYAYRIGLDKNLFRVSDDGEPSGSAGRPILSQIDSKEVTDVLIVVVRYFGGSLLGVPGLINAYKSSAVLALQVTPLVRKPVLLRYELHFDYTQMNTIMTIVKQLECEVIKQEMQLFCQMIIGIPKLRLDEALMKLKDIRDVTIEKINA